MILGKSCAVRKIAKKSSAFFHVGQKSRQTTWYSDYFDLVLRTKYTFTVKFINYKNVTFDLNSEFGLNEFIIYSPGPRTRVVYLYFSRVKFCSKHETGVIERGHRDVSAINLTMLGFVHPSK